MDRREAENAVALQQLRKHLGLHEQIPAVSFTHPLTAIEGDDGWDVTICAHDDANEIAHAVEISLSKAEFPSLDANVALTIARLQLTAGYN